MPVFRFSVRADRDLMEIAFYTLDTWGEAQTLYKLMLGSFADIERVSHLCRAGNDQASHEHASGSGE